MVSGANIPPHQFRKSAGANLKLNTPPLAVSPFLSPTLDADFREHPPPLIYQNLTRWACFVLSWLREMSEVAAPKAFTADLCP